MKEKKHLPVIGVGPIYVNIIIAITIVAIAASVSGKLNIVRIQVLRIPCFILGVLLAVSGVILWMNVLFKSGLDQNIRANKLVTTGVYAYVRNPIYFAFTSICTGALLIADNLYLLVLPFLYWLFLTMFMKCTEEKWLTSLYGEEYIEYCKRVNRCIPWFQKK